MANTSLSFVELAPPTVKAATLVNTGSSWFSVLTSFAVSSSNNDSVASKVRRQLLILCLVVLDLRTSERRARKLEILCSSSESVACSSASDSAKELGIHSTSEVSST